MQADLHFGELIISIIVVSKIVRIVVNKHWRVYLDFERAGSLYFTAIFNLPQLTAYARSSE